MPVNITDDTKPGENSAFTVIQKYIYFFILCQIILGAIQLVVSAHLQDKKEQWSSFSLKCNTLSHRKFTFKIVLQTKSDGIS